MAKKILKKISYMMLVEMAMLSVRGRFTHKITDLFISLFF